MTAAPPEATVLDTGARSDFAHVDRLDLLADRPRVVAVPAVKRELESGVETHPYLDAALAALGGSVPVSTPAPEAARVEANLRESLDPGEAQALAVAETAGGAIVTDDGDAREIARRRDVAATGSIGVLVTAVESDDLAVETADAYLKRWIDEAGVRSPARDIAAFLE